MISLSCTLDKEAQNAKVKAGLIIYFMGLASSPMRLLPGSSNETDDLPIKHNEIFIATGSVSKSYDQDAVNHTPNNISQYVEDTSVVSEDTSTTTTSPPAAVTEEQVPIRCLPRITKVVVNTRWVLCAPLDTISTSARV